MKGLIKDPLTLGSFPGSLSPNIVTSLQDKLHEMMSSLTPSTIFLQHAKNLLQHSCRPFEKLLLLRVTQVVAAMKTGYLQNLLNKDAQK